LWAGPAAAQLFDLSRNHMAISGVFIGLTEAELLAIKAKALAEVTSGVVMTNYSDSGSSVGKQVTMPARDRLAEAMYALQLLNPTTYGNPQSRVIRTDWSNYQD
jgi:NAD/NADP transhydrogenase beta subunit